MGGGFPIDLLLFGMIAAFLVLRLRGILGRRNGFERPPQNERQATERQGGERQGAERRAADRSTGPVPVPGMGRPTAAPGVSRPVAVPDLPPEPARPDRPMPDPASPAGVTLVRMRSVDRAFDPQHFLQGAEAAFRMIVAGFAAGDRVQLRALLADETYRSFETAIAAREAAGETQRSEIRNIERATIEEAVLDNTLAHITVRFVSDQVAETLSREGKPVAGADAVTEITDLWTFTRDLSQPDPAWRLSAARSG